MFLLNLLPDIVFHFIFILGCIGILASFILTFVPGFSLYKLPIQVISVLMLGGSLYFEGAIAREEEYKIQVAKLQEDLLKAQIQGEKVTTEVVYKVINKKQIIKEKGDTITEYIDREVVKVNPTCKIGEEVIKAHNAAAKNDPEILKSDTVVSTEEHNNLAKPTIKLPIKRNE